MNKYFATIGSDLTRAFPVLTHPPQNDFGDSLEQITTSEQEVLKLVKEINISKSSAIDNLSSKVLKDAFSSLIGKLTKIFNLSFQKGFVPTDWKHAIVIPLHKGGSTTEVNNFRPVSLLPIQGKLIEKMYHQRLNDWLEFHNYLDVNQGGFRKNHSTTDTAVNFLNDIYCALNEDKFTIAVYIDLRKAFDTVNHKKPGKLWS